MKTTEQLLNETQNTSTNILLQAILRELNEIKQQSNTPKPKKGVSK